MYFYSLLVLFFFPFSSSALLCAKQSAALLTSTEGDPEAIIANVNIITGDYCESVTDLSLLVENDTLSLQRFYNSKNYFTADSTGEWRILPYTFLVIGKREDDKISKSMSRDFDPVYAFTGERSGGVLTYSGWTGVNGMTKNPLKIDFSKNALGMVNTYAGEKSGKTNHKNNVIHCTADLCTVVLGDGTRRTYEKVEQLSFIPFSAQFVLEIAKQVIGPEYFRLKEEALPSGNYLLFSYDDRGFLASIKMTNHYFCNCNLQVRVLPLK